jgi:MinD-like ATPase involved in chromosome partitioning or flagellar assembly
LGAGSSLDNIELFLLADEKIIVITPQPTSIYEAFGFLKVCLLHALNDALADFPAVKALLIEEKVNRPEKMQITLAELMRKVAQIDAEAASRFEQTLQAFRPKVILNMVQSKDDVKEGMAFQLAATELLSIDLEYLGYVSADPMATEAVKSTKPLLLLAPECKAAQDLSALIRLKLLGQKGLKGAFEKWRGQRQLRHQAKEYPQLNVLKNAPICSVNCFYWDNCEYQEGGLPCRVRHLEPVLSDQK